MRISDWSSDVCPSDLGFVEPLAIVPFDRVGSRAQFPAPLETDHVEPHACAEAAPPLRTEFALKIGLALAHGLAIGRSEEHTSELQSLMRISYAVFCLKKKKSNISRKD